MSESKEQFFKRVAERRTKEILHKLEILGNCSTKSNYHYSQEEVKKIFLALKKKVAETEVLFTRKQPEEFQL